MSLTSAKQKIRRDAAIIFISTGITVLLLVIGFFDWILSITNGFLSFQTLVSGMMFTSVFTTPISIVALGKISLSENIFLVALLGGLGAMIIDLIIFKFFQERVSCDVDELMRAVGWKRFRHLIKLRFFRRFIFFVGALIIASPIPDEIGLAMMGFSRLRLRIFIPISFTMNFLGILAIAEVARLIT
jgi:hypothetical protein